VSAGLDPRARASILQVAAAMIPARDSLPSAGSEEVLGAWLDATVERRPELVRDVAQVAEAVAAERPEALLDGLIASSDPAAASFVEAVLEAYFADARVRDFFGYHGAPPEAAVADEGALRALIAPQLATGPRHRPAEDPAAAHAPLPAIGGRA
jgi:hypothetical protein